MKNGVDNQSMYTLLMMMMMMMMMCVCRCVFLPSQTPDVRNSSRGRGHTFELPRQRTHCRGTRTEPRWAGCHTPDWGKDESRWVCTPREAFLRAIAFLWTYRTWYRPPPSGNCSQPRILHRRIAGRLAGTRTLPRTPKCKSETGPDTSPHRQTRNL